MLQQFAQDAEVGVAVLVASARVELKNLTERVVGRLPPVVDTVAEENVASCVEPRRVRHQLTHGDARDSRIRERTIEAELLRE